MENTQPANIPPNVSSPAPPKKTKRRKWLYIFVAFSLLVCGALSILHCFSSDITAVADSDEALTAVAPDHVRKIHKAYSKQEGRAWQEVERKYKGKRLKLTGTVVDTKFDTRGAFGFPSGSYVEFDLKTFFSPHPTLGLQAYFDQSERASLASLKEGQKIVFIGTLSNTHSKVILFENCKLQ
ncbi:MAG: OB-fold putative lipoprotein [Cystobacterineae bacterium]|nr:OB-fold putative lipoprotein [Cystobacterineae bacterium]